MKKTFLTLFLVAASSFAFAEVSGAGTTAAQANGSAATATNPNDQNLVVDDGSTQANVSSAGFVCPTGTCPNYSDTSDRNFAPKSQLGASGKSGSTQPGTQ